MKASLLQCRYDLARAKLAPEIFALTKAGWEAHPLKEVYDASQSIARLADRFREAVWDTWLCAYYRKAKYRGHHAVVDGHAMLVWGAAGRVMITLKPEGELYAHLTFIAGDGETGPGRLGWQGVCASLSEATAWAQFFSAHSEELRAAITPDEEVTHVAVARIPVVITPDGDWSAAGWSERCPASYDPESTCYEQLYELGEEKLRHSRLVYVEVELEVPVEPVPETVLGTVAESKDALSEE
jgi:hypothetical protein